MAIKKTLTLVFLVLALGTTYGQKLKSRLVLTNGDTITTYVVDRKDDWSKKTIEIAQSKSAPITSFPISRIKELYIEEYKATYTCEYLEYDIKPIANSILEKDGTRHMVKDSILVQRLTSGPLTLYKHKDTRGKNHYFIQKQGQSIEPLLFVRYVREPSKQLVELPFYQARLDQLGADCPGLQTKVTTLDDPNLLKFVKGYNRCLSGKDDSEAPKDSDRGLISVRGGISAGSAAFNGNDAFSYTKSNGDYTRSPKPLVELGFEFATRRPTSRHRLALFAGWQQTGLMSRTGQKQTVFDLEYHMDARFINYGFRYSYLFTTVGVKTFVRASIEGLSVSGTANRHRYDASNGETQIEPFTDFASFGYGASLGLGARWKNIEIEPRVRYNTLPSGSYYSSTTLLSTELILGYYIGI